MTDLEKMTNPGLLTRVINENMEIIFTPLIPLENIAWLVLTGVYYGLALWLDYIL